MTNETIDTQIEHTQNQNIIEELEIIEARELQIGHAFHAFHFD